MDGRSQGRQGIDAAGARGRDRLLAWIALRGPAGQQSGRAGGRRSRRLLLDGADRVAGAGGHKPQGVNTTAEVTLEKLPDGFAITGIALATEATVAGVDDAQFQQIAQETKKGCPVSKALAATPITLTATLRQG